MKPEGEVGGEPPRKLGKNGLELWRSVQAAFGIGDVGGIELLAQACAALDRAEACRAHIDRDGEMVVSKTVGLRNHRLLKHELAARAFVVRTLQKLGITDEPVKAIGRPGKHIGIQLKEW